MSAEEESRGAALVPAAHQLPAVRTSGIVQRGMTLAKTLSIERAEASREEAVSLVETPTQGQTKTNPKDGAEMVWIPEGEFLMGSRPEEIDALLQCHPKKEWLRYELPQHRVYLDGYWIYRYDVTVGQYRKFCEATARPMPSAPRWGWNEDHPIVKVTWLDAKAYCEWAGVRLPTEAEWEKAARGTDGRTYPWGNKWDTSKCRCWTNNMGDAGGTAPVGSFSNGTSPYGVHDMAGNVWDWCADWYDGNYYQNSPSRNPQGPASGKYRVLRGGSWNNFNVDNFRCSRRTIDNPDDWDHNHGFRCVQGRS